MSWWRPSDVGLAVRRKLADIGQGARFFVRLIALLGPTLRRFSLVRDQVHFLGNYSLAIIAVSGLFVGFVLALQGYNILQRYGSSERTHGSPPGVPRRRCGARAKAIVPHAGPEGRRSPERRVRRACRGCAGSPRRWGRHRR